MRLAAHVAGNDGCVVGAYLRLQTLQANKTWTRSWERRWVQNYNCNLLHKNRSGCSSQRVSEGLCVCFC